MDYTPDQIEKLKSLGIDIKTEKEKTSSFFKGGCSDLSEQEGLEIGNLKLEIKHPRSNVFPLLSISGLTLLSFSGLILLKGNSSKTSYGQTDVSVPNQLSDISPTPTQVPKSIQHYLLTSQQYFSQALQSQKDQSSTVDLLNKSILAATSAIKEFPNDYRGYQQRGRIYQSLTDSQPKLIDQSISDIAAAQKLNPSSAEITHTLASLYAKKGDTQNTILYLNQTVSLEPTKAQNFYDLAKIQQQVGLLPQALETYNRLITIITDTNQKTQLESEKLALEKLISQNPNSSSEIRDLPSDISAPPSEIRDLPSEISTDAPTIQALTDGGLIIAAPEDDAAIAVTNQTDSNSLSGNAILTANQKEINVSNTNLNSTSQVYVTATKGGKNQNLQVLSKSEKSFTVGLTSPISEDIEFKWWIIN